MDLKSFPVESGKIFLADTSEAFRELEGEDTPVDERVWVVVRQASQADNIKRADLHTKREIKYTANELGQVDSWARVYSDNALRRRMVEVYLTLKEVGNLMSGDKPVFDKMPAKEIEAKRFEAIWGDLHPVVAEAIHEAVLQQNPDWRFDRQGE